jgi:hypothetical protein
MNHDNREESLSPKYVALTGLATLFLCFCMTGCLSFGTKLANAEKAKALAEKNVINKQAAVSEELRQTTTATVDSLSPAVYDTNNLMYANIHLAYEYAKMSQSAVGTPMARINVDQQLADLVSTNLAARLAVERQLSVQRTETQKALQDLSKANDQNESVRKENELLKTDLAVAGAKFKDFVAKTWFYVKLAVVIIIVLTLTVVAFKIWSMFDPAAKVGGISVSLAGQVAKKAFAQVVSGGEKFKDWVTNKSDMDPSIKLDILDQFRLEQKGAQDLGVQNEIKRLTSGAGGNAGAS